QTIFYHQCAGWSHERRFLAVRYLKKVDKSGLFDMSDYDYFCYVTTDESLTPLQTHHKYGERATCETWIDECKNQMKACNIRTKDFFANAALFQCSILAYNIIKWMALLAGGKVRHWEVKTIRLYIVRVAGKLIESARQLTLKLPRMFLYQDEWRRWEQMSLSVSFD
ncbi:transposase, partial [Candidatus Magnetobacterium bavaricum]